MTTAPPLSPYATDGSLRFGVSFLVDHFRAFHAELVRLRGDADLAPTWIPNNDLDGDLESSAADPAMTICQRLAQRLEQDTIEAQRLGGALGIRLYREAGFIMAALADEILLHGPAWIGQARWKTTLLESRMFKTYDGGERFFQKLDALLDARDPIETQLAVVYLLTLKLGFEGKYRGEPEAATLLNRYRVRLFEFVANRAPDTGYGAPPITPGAYAHILSVDKRPFLPYVWGWAAALAAFLVLFLLISHLTWQSIIEPVLAIVQGASMMPVLFGVSLFWIALVVGVLALLVLIYVILVVRKMSVARPAVEDEMPPAVGAPAAESSAPSGQNLSSLQASFAAAVAGLKQAVTGRNFRYSVPWILLMGDSDAGKWAVLEAARLALPMGRSLDGPKVAGSGCAWWFFEQGVALDITGTLLDGDDRAWRQVLRLLQRHRPRLPLDGMVLAIPASDLIATDNLARERLAAKAAQWNRRLWQAQKTLGLRIPITILVTKCDLVRGFSSFWRNLPAHHAHEMFGWSNPHAPDMLYNGDWVEAAFATLRDDIDTAQLEIAADPRILGDADEMMGFPAAFASLKGPLRAYLDQFLQVSTYYESVPLRGIYFCGRLSDEGPAIGALPGLVRDLFARKLFAERGLATPIAGSLISRNRTVRIVQATLALAVVGLSTGFGISVGRLNREVDGLLPILRQVAEGVSSVHQKEVHMSETVAGDVTFFRKDDAIRLLDLMSRVRTHSLEPIFMPTSLFSGADREFRSFLTDGFDTVILWAMRDQLELRTRKALDDAEKTLPVGSDDASLDIEHVAEFGQLKGFVGGLHATESLSALYDNLGNTHSLDDLQTLVRTLFDVDLPSSFVVHKELFADVLGDVSHQTFDVTAFRSKATPRARALVWRLYNHLFQSGAIIHQLYGLTEQLRDLATPADDLDGEALLLTHTQQALDQLSDTLGKPEGRWIAAPQFDLGDSFRLCLAQIAASNFFDHGLSEELAALGQGEFQRFQTRLAAYSAPLVGPILQQDDQGHIQAALAAPVAHLAAALDMMFKQDFMQVPAPVQIETEFESNRRLVWDTDKLAEATRYYEHYDHFVAEQLEGLPASLRERAARLALARLQANMSAAVARAQHFEDGPAGDMVATEEALDTDIRNFRAAAPFLERLLTVFRQLDMATPLAAVQTVGTDQAHDLLMRTDLLLDTDKLYQPLRPLSEWDGSTAAGLFAYQVGDGAEMQRYLDTERTRLQHLFSDYGMPLVTFLSGRSNSRLPEDRAVLTRWQRIFEELGKYNNHRPDNSLSTLEHFLRVDMLAVTAANCNEFADAGHVAHGSSDYFEQRRQNLIVQVRQRCNGMSTEGLSAKYRTLENRFNDSLAGRYPFAADASGGEADIEDVRAFFRDYGADIAGMRDRMSELAGTDARHRRAAVFLRQLAQTSAFFKAIDGEENGAAGPAARLSVDFRADREDEHGGNQIIEWALQAGAHRVVSGDADHSILWRPGDPITVSLRWAKDSAWHPVVGDDTTLTVADDTASFAAKGRWSLMQLLEAHGTPGDGARTGAPLPSLLRFDVPLEPGGERAVVFLRLAVSGTEAVAAGRQRATILPISQFPVLAPDQISARDHTDAAGGAP